MALVFEIKVFPGSGKQKWVLDTKSGILKCYLKSPAEKGKANAELIKFIAHTVQTTQDMITIVAGAHSRKKIMRIALDISYERLLDLCGIQQQTVLFKK